MRGFMLFLISTLLFSLITLILFIFCFTTYNGLPLQQLLDKPDRVQALTSLLALILGTAATFAGAIATLRVASLGLNISERQEKVDALDFLESRFTKTTEIFSSILLGIGNLYAAGIIVESNIPALNTESMSAENNIVELMIRDVPKSLSVELEYLCEALTSLINSLLALAQDEFSVFCLARNIIINDSKLDNIRNKIIRYGYTTNETDLSLGNLSDIIAILEIAKRKLKRNDLSLVVQARLYTNATNSPIFDLNYNNASVRSFFLLGNLLYSYSSSLSDGRVFIVSYGAAILRDLISSIPNESVIKESLCLRYPELSFAISSLKSKFNPQTLLSKSVSAAINEIDKIGDLYCLISNK